MALSRYGGIVGAKKISEDFDNINNAFNNVAAESDINKATVDGHIANGNIHTTAEEKSKLAGITAGAGGANSATDSVIGSRTATESATPSLTGTITALFSSLFTLIKGITGKSSSLTAPAITLEATKTHVDDTTVHLTAAERTAWNGKVDKVTGKQLSTEDYSTPEKTKLAGIAAGAEVNQSAFSKVNGVTASSKTDTLTVVGGTGITITEDTATKKLTVTATGEATPGAHASSHLPGGSDPIPMLAGLEKGAAGGVAGLDANAQVTGAGLKLGSALNERVFRFSFENGVANQRVDLYRTGVIAGVVEVTVAGTWGNSNVTGKMKKVFSIAGSDNGGGIAYASSPYSEVSGAIADGIAISDMQYNSATGTFVIYLESRTAFGNSYAVTVRALHSIDDVAWTMGPIYTSASAPSLPKAVQTIPDGTTTQSGNKLLNDTSVSGIGKIGNYVANADILYDNGFYNVPAEWTGSPFPGADGANQGYLNHFTWNDGGTYAHQLFMPINTGDISKKSFRYRRKINGTWDVAWTPLYGAENNFELFIVRHLFVTGNVNSYTDPGTYVFFEGSYTNGPTAGMSYGLLKVYVGLNGFLEQEAISVTAPYSKSYRTRTENDWGPWKRILTDSDSASFAPAVHEHSRLVATTTVRDIKPNLTGKGQFAPYFVSRAGLNGAVSTDYADMLVLNTYDDGSGGSVNALVFDKGSMQIFHYQAPQTNTVWGKSKTLAYTEDIVQGTHTYAVTTGTGTGYAANLNPAVDALNPGLHLTIKAHAASAGPITLTVNGLEARPIKKPNGNNPPLALGGVYTLVYDGSVFQLQGEGGEYGTAGAADVLVGKTIGTEPGIVPGAMPNRSAENNHMPALQYTTWVGDRVFLAPPAGYYDGSSWVTAPATDVRPENIRLGKRVLGIDGALIEGSRTASGIRAAVTISSTANWLYVDGIPGTPRVITFCSDSDPASVFGYYNSVLGVQLIRGYSGALVTSSAFVASSGSFSVIVDNTIMPLGNYRWWVSE